MFEINFFKMERSIFMILFVASSSFAQRVYLRADGNSVGTYNLINSVLGGTAVEVPDCVHPIQHITQVHDIELNIPVFNFHSHVENDNDRCIRFDRMRTEIKTYDKSPDHLIGFYRDRVSYSWDLKLDSEFQPSTAFTHIFQVKPVGGEDSQPFITLTPRLRSGNRFLQLIHSGMDSIPVVVWEGPLANFAGKWIHIAVEYTCATAGTFHIVIKQKSNDQPLMYYTNNNLEMWRTGNAFQRPKWGIYRSLNNQINLRNENVYFNNFCLTKGDPRCE